MSEATEPRGAIALRTQDLRVRFGGIEALGGVSLTCERGQVVAVIGPNGAGKSTLFNAICGLVQTAGGQVAIDGVRLGRPKLALRDVAIVCALGLLGVLLTSNLDALWRHSVVEPYRAEVMAARRQEPAPDTGSTLLLAWRSLLGAPFVHAQRDGFCVLEADGSTLECTDSWQQADERRVQASAARTGAQRASTVALAVRWLLATSVAAWWWWRRRASAAWSPRALAQAGVARTFQNIRLFDELSAADNVRVVIEQAQLSAEDTRATPTPDASAIDARVAALLQRVGLAARAQQAASELSYGERRRLEIARALALSPRVLLLDEPAAGLHAGETAELLSLVKALRQEGMAILLIEHDMALVMGVSDHVVVLDHGAFIAQGTPAQVRRDPRVIAAYLGDQPQQAALEATSETPEKSIC